MSATRRHILRFRGRAAGKQRSRAFTLTVGFGALAIAAAMFYVGYRAPQSVPFRSYYNIHALLRNGDNLEDHYDVRIGGVRAGQVLHPRVHDHLAEIDLQLSSKFKPLLSDTRIEIRLRSAVGVRYVNIIPGTRGTPLPEGATLPVSQSSAPVDLDQVLRTFNPATRTHTRQLLGELGTGLLGRGQDVNDTLHTVPGLLTSVGSVSQAINSRPGAVRDFIHSTQGAAAAFDPVRAPLATGFAPEERALLPFALHRGDVERTLEQAPPTLAELRTGLPRVTALVDQVGGLARNAEPALRLAPAALEQTTALLDQARPGLRGLRGTLGFAHRAVTPALVFLQSARGVLPDVDRAIRSALPIVTYVAPRSCGLSDAFTGWSEMMKWGTDVNNFIRFTVTETGTVLTGQRTVNLPSTPYPGPCHGHVGEAGWERQTPEQQAAVP
jgi:ABC-type transporter Mla subunit MlaD